MSLTYGFYNSQNGDRVYSTSQLSDFLDGLITDGVFAPISDGEETHHGLKVVALPTPAMAVHVSVGKAWFNGTWTYIDSAYQVNLAQASLVLNRIDAIVLTINKTRASRSNYIEVISGTETSGTPEKPVVQGDTDIYRYVLAWVTVNANTQAITDSLIEDNIGTESGIPFVDLESPLGGNYPSTEALLLQYKTEFDEWFNHMKDQLDTDAAGHLQAEIDTRDDNLAEEYNSTSTYENGDFSMDDGVLKKFNGTIWVPKNVTDEIKDMKSTFQAGVDAIYNAEVTQNVSGVPAASTPTALADGVGAIATTKYNAGINAQQAVNWDEKMTIVSTASTDIYTPITDVYSWYLAYVTSNIDLRFSQWRYERYENGIMIPGNWSLFNLNTVYTIPVDSNWDTIRISAILNTTKAGILAISFKRYAKKMHPVRNRNID